MPLYYCTISEGSTSNEQRSRIAAELTRIHCETTGAPPAFVHVFFVEARGAGLPDGKRAMVLGSIRAGRTPEQKERLASEMGRAVAEILGRRAEEVSVSTAEIPARWVMEGGEVLPEPGEEGAWLARHA